MNFLSPDDVFMGTRRKSLCNGAILTFSNGGNASTSESASPLPNKAKKERRRGSFNESSGRRSSLVSRWFKHISDAAEQYKQRSKSSHEVVDDPASTTLPHSNTKESLENTPESQTLSSATATATGVGNPNTNNNISEREYAAIPEKGQHNFCNNNNGLENSGAYGGEITEDNINRTDYQNESNNNEYDTPNIQFDSGKKNQSHSSNIAGDEAASVPVTRGDNSSLYSNNSNNTRTLMQNSLLVEPSAIQISISPAHTAEPVLTPSERLKRLDNSIRENLVEKHKIICDMFRLPIEHFNEIVDIVAQPEAPKDSSDIALAAYAQVQSLTEVLNDYMKINSAEQEISAVSTVVCDQCHQSQQQALQPQIQPILSNTKATTKRSVSPILLSTPSTSAALMIPDELLNSTPVVQSLSVKTSTSNIVLSASASDNDQIIHEDDDGYCEIDELRLPSVPITKSAVSTASVSGTFKATLPKGVGLDVTSSNVTTPEILKRQSTISTDSIPEESEHDATHLDEPMLGSIVCISKTTASKEGDDSLILHDQNSIEELINQSQLENTNNGKVNQHNYPNDTLCSEHIEINDNYDTLNFCGIDGNDSAVVHQCQSPGLILCGPNRLLHANSLEPSVPCHLINGIVSTLNSQISLLLPKINERDQERERLRRENQHLRELLNAMHERQRVEANTKTPAEITISAESSAETAIITSAVAEQSTIEQTSFS